MAHAVAVDEPVHHGFSHEVCFYRGVDDLAATLVPFIQQGVRLGEPVLVALVPEKLRLLDKALGRDAAAVTFVDMSRLGANPACIIPAWRRFLDEAGSAGPVRGVGEPVWSGRRDVELEEAALHEALLNLAFDGGPGWRLQCPYDVEHLGPEIIDEALRNHPVAHAGAGRDMGYGGHEHATRSFSAPLREAPGHAARHRFADRDLIGVRELVRRYCRESAMDPNRADDLVLATHELATNSVLHGGGQGELVVWHEPSALAVEVRDSGTIGDPLVGRGTQDLLAEHGRGIWMANQLCDLVQVRSGKAGTQVRLWAWL